MIDMSHIEPPRPERGQTGAERGPNLTSIEREVTDARTMPQKLLAAANPKNYFGMVKHYPAGTKQFLWLCLGILYPFWLLGVLVAWPVIIVLKAVGWVLFQIWWFCTGWFWKRLGGEKPSKERRAEIDQERAAKLADSNAQQYE
ncbi:conserved hypothetical protein [Aeromicrobium sp. 9AM]|nr:conserved hypothetical protein [Aeromicrobium sp. 9AM]